MNAVSSTMAGSPSRSRRAAYCSSVTVGGLASGDVAPGPPGDLPNRSGGLAHGRGDLLVRDLEDLAEYVPTWSIVRLSRRRSEKPCEVTPFATLAPPCRQLALPPAAYQAGC